MRLPPTSGRRLVQALVRLGFEPQRIHGSHAILVRRQPFAVASVPLHAEVKAGTLAAILRQTGVSRTELAAALR